MDDQLTELLRAMIRTERSSRAAPTAAALSAVKDGYTARNALGMGRFPVDLDRSVATEYELRARAYLALARRVWSETETPWTRSMADSVMHVLATELAADTEELLNRMSTTVGPQRTARREALDAAADRMRAYLEQESSLLVIRQDRTRLPLSDLLAAPRYAAVLASWKKSDEFFRAEPPDLANAAKEAIGAVEALARLLTGEPKATLGDCIKRLRASGRIAPVMLKGIEELWALTSDSPGVRPGGSVTDLAAPTARYVADLSESALRLLLAADAA